MVKKIELKINVLMDSLQEEMENHLEQIKIANEAKKRCCCSFFSRGTKAHARLVNLKNEKKDFLQHLLNIVHATGLSDADKHQMLLHAKSAYRNACKGIFSRTEKLYKELIKEYEPASEKTYSLKKQKN